MVVGRVVAPPAPPLLVAPRATDRAEHVAAHDRRADPHVALRGKPVVNALVGLVGAILAEHLAEGAGRERPRVQLVSAHTERVLRALVWPDGVAVERDGPAIAATGHDDRHALAGQS
jgi:hypothetical protein